MSNALRVSIGFAPQILAVKIKEVERAMHRFQERAVSTDQIKYCKAVFVCDDCLAVDQA